MSVAVAERLLDGGGGPAPLPHLVAAATAPATATELCGEPAARAAFRSAVHTVPRPYSLPHDLPRRPRVRTPTTIWTLKAIAAIALAAGTAGGVALATQASPTAPAHHLSTTNKTSTDTTTAGDPLPAALATTPSATALPAAGPAPDTPGGRLANADDDTSGTAARTRPTAATHPTGRCRASANITDPGQAGEAAASPAFTELSCTATPTSRAEPTGRPGGPPGNPDRHTGKPDPDRPADTSPYTGPAAASQPDTADQADKAARPDAAGQPDGSADDRDANPQTDKAQN